MAAVARLNRIWRCSTINIASKLKLYMSLVTSILLYGVKHGPCLLIRKKKIQAFETMCMGNFSVSPTWSTRPTTWCGARSTFLWVHRNLFWQLSRDRNLHGSGMSHATKASPKLSLRAPWRVGNTVASGENAGWTSKSAYSCPCQSCSQGPPAEKAGRGSLLNHLSCPPNDPFGQGTNLNWIEPLSVIGVWSIQGWFVCACNLLQILIKLFAVNIPRDVLITHSVHWFTTKRTLWLAGDCFFNRSHGVLNSAWIFSMCLLICRHSSTGA